MGNGALRRLAGRTVLVVGPPHPLPPALARAARAHGAQVASSTRGASPEGVFHPGEAFGAFVTEAAVDRLFDSVVRGYPTLDTVIAVVAAEPLGLVHELSPDLWRQRATEPLRIVFWMVRRAVEEFLGTGTSGRLVLVLTTPTGLGPANEIVEGALRSFVRSFAKEYGRRSLSCNLVVAAARGRSGGPIHLDWLTWTLEHVLFLASEGAAFVNGEALVVGRPAEWSPERTERAETD